MTEPTQSRDDSDGWFSSGLDEQHQRWLDGIGHCDVDEPELDEPH